MKNIKAFYKLSEKRQKVEEDILIYDEQIKELRETAKTLKKGSEERQDLMRRANELKECEVYKLMQRELKTLNYCINVTFYN